jgi:hypothetical protein
MDAVEVLVKKDKLAITQLAYDRLKALISFAVHDFKTAVHGFEAIIHISGYLLKF